ncbi:hypothetical protein [Luteolibacter sp. LG18]|uniref:COG1470 family protein n=1 Tax=Luteolibacter sp. LG18 TaxID=2819286 RepID=UPI002B2AA587|nr:hypothetical protein llg_28610 [Luteolibacter sp. LG18]
MKLLVNAARVACGSAWLFLVTTAAAQVVPTAPVVAVGAPDMHDWKGLGEEGMAVPGEISFHYPEGTKGWYQEGFRVSHDGTADWRAYQGLQIDVEFADERPVELTARINIPPQLQRADYVETTAATVTVGGKGSRTLSLPWSAFDFQQAQPAFLKFARELVISAKPASGGAAGKLRIKAVRLVKAAAVSLEAEVRGRSAEGGGKVYYPVTVGNTTGAEQNVTLRIAGHGWQSMKATVEPALLRIAAGQTGQCVVAVEVPAGVPAGGREEQVLQAVADGDGSRAPTLAFTTTRRMAPPYILHTPERWDEVREMVKNRDWAKREQQTYVETSSRWQVPEVAKPPRNTTPDSFGAYLFVTPEENNMMAAAYSWQLTREKAHAEKVALFLRRLSDPVTGYPATLRGCNQSLVQEGHFFQHLAMAYDMIGDSGVLTAADHAAIETTFRAYITTDLLDLNGGAISNWTVSQHTGALYAALALQDLALVDRLLNGPAGLIDHMRHGIMDDGWWYECSISYNVWVATEFSQLAVAMRPWGVNLVEGWVPSGYTRNYGIRPWESKDGLYGMSFEKQGPVRHNYVDLKRFWDALPVFADYRGIMFGINDTTERALGGAGYELAYRLFRDPAYAAIIKRDGKRDLIYGVPDLPEETPDLSGQSAHADNVGVAMLRSTQQDPAERIQAVLHYGTHGGFHGHFDRGGLLSLMRYGKSFYNPEMIWYGYQCFLYKFYVQTSMSKNMVVVDQKMQEPVESDLLLFHTGSLMQATAVESNARWSDPPFGGMRYPELIGLPLADKLWMEGRSIPIPADAKPYGEIGDYSDRVRQRRAMVVMDDYVVLADSMRAEKEHVYDSLLQIKGYEGFSGEVKPLRHDAQMTTDGKSAAQFITDCDWFTARGDVTARFNSDGLKLDVRPLWPADKQIMIGAAPENQPVNKQLHYAVRGGGKVLAEGKFGAWILGQAEIDVPVADLDALELETRVNTIEGKSVFWGDARIVKDDGSEVPLSKLPLKNRGVEVPTQPGRDYLGGPVKIAGLAAATSVGGQPSAKDTPGIVEVDLRGSGAKRFKARLGSDFPLGDESALRKTWSVRQQGKDARFLTLIEPRQSDPKVKRATADGPDHLRVELADGRVHDITFKQVAGTGSSVEVKVVETKDGKVLREETSVHRP